MSASMTLSVPRIAGMGGGVGTTLVATLLAAPFDAGEYQAGDQVDVLVCESVTGSVAKAIAAGMMQPIVPVLVVVDDCGRPWPKTVRQRVEMARPNFPRVVRVPWLERLRSVDDPHAVLAEALHSHTYLDEVPGWAMPMQKAAAELTAAVTTLLTPAQEVPE